MSVTAALEQTAPLCQRVKSVILERPLSDKLVRPVPAVPDPVVLWLTVDPAAARAFAGQSVLEGRLPPPDQAPSAWLEHGATALERLDPELVRSLRLAGSRKQPVIVVRGLTAGPVLPRTPYEGAVDIAASGRAIANLHAVLGCLGLHPVAYAGESASTLHPVCPRANARGELSSRGFDRALPFHTDYADRPIDEGVHDQSPAAAVLAFAIERAEAAVPMECAALAQLLSVLPLDDVRAGEVEDFLVHAPAIFRAGPAARTRRLFLPGERGRLNLGRMIGRSGRAAHLLREVAAILSDPGMVEPIPVRRGDVVIMDNQRVLHRRASFAPRWDGTDRYFIRASAVRDPLAGMPADPRRPWIWS